MRTLTKLTLAIRHAQRTHSILPPSSTILIALSGGQDSTALTEALLSLHATAPFAHLSAVHCDHGWALDAGNAHHIRGYAESRGLRVAVLTPPRAVATTEAAARAWRYAALAEHARDARCGVVVTAHTRTDVAETLLMGLSRGAAVPIPWERELADGVRLVRPLLDVPRWLTGAVCRERGVDVWQDVYNEDERYLRNRVRKRVMPVVKELVNGRAEEGFARVADVLREEGEFVEGVAAEVYETAVRVEGGVWLDAKILRNVHKAVRRRVVKKALMEIGCCRRRVFGQVEMVCGVIQGRRGGDVGEGKVVTWIDGNVFIAVDEHDVVANVVGA